MSKDPTEDFQRTREFNEREVRAATRLLMHQLIWARTTVGKWLDTNHRPTKDELFVFAMTLKTTQDELFNLALLPPGSGHDLDFSIERIAKAIEIMSPGFISASEGDS